MRKFFLGAALSATIIAGNMAPVLANSTNINTDGEVTAHSVEVNPNLVEIEGRTLTDAEASEVEGEWLWVIPVGGAVGGVAINGYQNHSNGRPVFQNWGSSAVIGAGNTTCLAITRGRSPVACSAMGHAWNSRKGWSW